MGHKNFSWVDWQLFHRFRLVLIISLIGLVSPSVGFAVGEELYPNRCVQSSLLGATKSYNCFFAVQRITLYSYSGKFSADSPEESRQNKLLWLNSEAKARCLADPKDYISCNSNYVAYGLLNHHLVSTTYNMGRYEANGGYRNERTDQNPNYWVTYPGPISAQALCPTPKNWFLLASPTSDGLPGVCACPISSGTCDTPPPAPPKHPKDPPNTCPSTPNPIAIGTGHKWLIEQDITSHYLAMGLDFQRYYSSARYQDLAHIGTAWTHTYAANIQPYTSDLVKITRPDGREYVFGLSAGKWIADADITDTLTELKSGTSRIGWLYTVNSTGVDETYNATGQLLQIENRAGLAQTLTYNDLNQLTQVTNSLGQSLYFNYDVANHISQIINPAGASTSYGYDATGNLTSVTYPDGKTKTYHYGADTAEAANIASTPSAGVSYESSLTGITDENGTRIASYRYDAEGRAYDEEHAPDLALGIHHYRLDYNMGVNDVPISTVVTDPRGTSRVYNFTTVLDVVKSTGQSQPAGSGCAASAAAITYDSNGNVASRTDFAGHQTTYQYDLTRNLETSRTEGLTATGVATTATRTITTTWHATWHLPLVITEYNGATATGTALKQTTHVYDTKGNLTSVKETDPARTLNRTTTITYTYSTELPSLVLSKVVNGSRTDVADTTTYTYYPHNAACVPSTKPSITNPITGTPPDNLGCRGQLKTVTNALGHTITYDRYNHHGQVEQTTDANGVITTNSYDARQRLTSRSTSSANTGTQTTHLSYDDAGQITQLKMPDNSVLNYFYDAAHRLTDVQDTLGNTVHYTLDAAGNRIAESTTDPQGNLANTITRSFDALNRLKTVTGVE
ncbi:MAG: RHS repeat protein [Methylotenera sp.]|nr:RHS repeat protein [Methylotenera sp.]